MVDMYEKWLHRESMAKQRWCILDLRTEIERFNDNVLILSAITRASGIAVEREMAETIWPQKKSFTSKIAATIRRTLQKLY